MKEKINNLDKQQNNTNSILQNITHTLEKYFGTLPVKVTSEVSKVLQKIPVSKGKEKEILLTPISDNTEEKFIVYDSLIQ